MNTVAALSGGFSRNFKRWELFSKNTYYFLELADECNGYFRFEQIKNILSFPLIIIQLYHDLQSLAQHIDNNQVGWNSSFFVKKLGFSEVGRNRVFQKISDELLVCGQLVHFEQMDPDWTLNDWRRCAENTEWVQSNTANNCDVARERSKQLWCNKRMQQLKTTEKPISANLNLQGNFVQAQTKLNRVFAVDVLKKEGITAQAFIVALAVLVIK